jgi:hypothetical protein
MPRRAHLLAFALAAHRLLPGKRTNDRPSQPGEILTLTHHE